MENLVYVEEPKKPTMEDFGNREQPGLWMTHDPAAYQDPVSKNYYIYSTGALLKKSEDMIHFTSLGKVCEVPEEAYEWTKSRDIWAPDIVKVGDEYRLYCSNSSWGVQQSCIFLAVSSSPEGPFEPRGIVIKTSDKLPVNAIDANIITDAKTGQMYMLYGSFWGGCYVLELDVETGLSKNPCPRKWTYDKKSDSFSCEMKNIIGTCVAKRPKYLSTAVEGPYMIYNEVFDFYYLFVSYGSLKSDYNICVGRSKHITGPFLDSKGESLISALGTETAGNLLMAGYEWNDGISYMAPGHNSVLRNEENDFFLVTHIREKNFHDEPEPSTMQVRRIYFSEDGWPYVESEVYAGKAEHEFTKEELLGFYERIDFYKTIPQGISVSTPMKLGEESYYEHCSVCGEWEMTDGNHLEITYGPYKEKTTVAYVFDRERQVTTIGICGIDEEGRSFWAKKISD
ncbi:MAG: arabinan endo-1,5-alpha-L-arabinosidase [Lachnospiraceae bacterium]|nr:arabinan endo-1,5-alpha-L-arabinosidase [Lachnospiraceae bacterium]